MSDAEYEVESVTKARVDVKRGKKIIWKYYVKWKGYTWDESTWEPEKSFSGGSKHFIKSFWDHALTRGREYTNPELFGKGEEVYASGFPGANPRLTNESSRATLRESPSEKSEDVSDDEPLTTKKRRRRQKPVGEPKAKRKRESEPGIAKSASAQQRRAFGPKSKAKTSKTTKQRRASSPGPRKVGTKRRLSLTDMTDTDAVGEIDMDVFGEVKEVEDKLMPISPDVEDISESHVDSANVSGMAIEDLHRYDTIEASHVVTEDEILPVDEGRSSPDPLFDSPPQPRDGGSRSSAEPTLPFHRARAANPLVKLIDAPRMLQDSGVAISAKARLISCQPSSSTQDAGSSNGIPKIRPKPGPGRLSVGLLSKNRSSLLTAGKGGLASVKGRFKPIKDAREEPEPIEDAPGPSHDARFNITSWSDEDGAGETSHEHQALASSAEPVSNHAPIPLPVPSGHELLEIAGLNSDADALPDFEEANIKESPQSANAVSAETVADVTIEGTAPASMTVQDEAAGKSLAEAKEQLFPSVQPTTSALSIPTSSWKTSKDNTIFGRMYKIQEPVQRRSEGNESIPTFKLNLNANASIPLVLKDMKDMKGISFTDLSADKSLDGQAGSFYLFEDAVKIVSTFLGLGSARVVPDAYADENQKGHFDKFQQRLHSGQMFVAKAGKELLVFFCSQNVEISEKLAPPQVLMGLANTVLLVRVQIIDSSGYANAVMQIAEM